MLGSRVGLAARSVCVAVAAVLLGFTAGCQSNPEPAPLEAAEPSSSAPSSASPTPSPPAMPAEAKAGGAAGAKAFVRHYIDLVNYAMATGDITELESLANSGCATCKAITRRIAEIHTDGGRAEGKGWRIKTLSTFPTNRQRSILVAAAIHIAPQTVYSKTAPPTATTQSRGNLDFHLRREADRWRIDRLQATQ